MNRNIERIEVVDNEKFYILKDTFIEDKKIKSDVFLFETLKQMFQFAESREDFCVSIHKWKGDNDIWIPCMLSYVNGTWKRVHIEKIRCEHCGWYGNIANPTLPELYFSLYDSTKALKEAWNLPEKKCPVCKRKLNRYAIWTES